MSTLLYSRKELEDMVDDPDSELAEYAQKRSEKKKVKYERKARKNKKEENRTGPREKS